MRVLALTFLLMGCEDKPSDNATNPAEGAAEVTVPVSTENNVTTSESAILSGNVQENDNTNQNTDTPKKEGEVNNDND